MIDPVFQFIGVALFGSIIFGFFRQHVSRYVDETASRLRPIGIVAIVVAVVLTGYLVSTGFTRGSLPPVTLSQPSAPKPHVIIIVLDALASRDMSLYGYHLKTTPHLDQLSKTWTVFENAHSTATTTLAVQPAILSGRYPYFNDMYRYGDLARRGEQVLTLSQALRSFGYTTIYGAGGGWAPSQYHFHNTFDHILGGGYSGVLNPHSIVHTIPGRDWLNRTVWNAPFVADALLGNYNELGPATQSLDEPMYDIAKTVLQVELRDSTSTPLFLYLHMNRPHQPYLANEFMGTLLPKNSGLTNIGSQEPYIFHSYTSDEQATIDQLRLRYDENIMKADQQVGLLVEQLQALGVYDQSLIIVTADHGSTFANGEQGYYTHDLSAVEHNVPLLVKFPGQQVGRRERAAVSLVDIVPTVLEVIGAAAPDDWVDGQSLQLAAAHPDRTVFVSRYDRSSLSVDSTTVAAVSGDMKRVERPDGEWVYNLRVDPDEQRDVSSVSGQCLQEALDLFKQRRAFIEQRRMFRGVPPLDDRCNDVARR